MAKHNISKAARGDYRSDRSPCTKRQNASYIEIAQAFCESSPQLAIAEGKKGSMAGTPLELSEKSSQNLLHNSFCHLVFLTKHNTLDPVSLMWTHTFSPIFSQVRLRSPPDRKCASPIPSIRPRKASPIPKSFQSSFFRRFIGEDGWLE